MPATNLNIIQVDYSNPDHCKDIVYLLDTYASGEMGGGQPLSDFVRENLITELAKRSTAHVLLAYVDSTPAGLMVCFEGFSTFVCKPLINIHDVIVHPDFRGRGIATAMFAKIEELAKSMDCCKLTLEVLSENKVAQGLYLKCGFAGYELKPETGHALFWQKKLDSF